MPIMGERSFLKLMAPVKLSTTSASHVSFSPIAHSSPAISAKLTHLFSSADRPAAMAITSATRPSLPEHGEGLPLTSASTKASVSCM